MINLTIEEKDFIERVRPLLKAYLELCEEKGIDPGAGSYVLSESNNIYHGVPFVVARGIHGEENAIGTMLTEEGITSKLKMILIVGSPEEPILPCGMCRVAIWRYSMNDTTVLCADQSFIKIEKYTISELYPYAYKDLGK